MIQITRTKLVSMAAIAFSLGIYYLSVWTVGLENTSLANLNSIDAEEYACGAVSIHEELSYYIRIGEDRLPPRYAPGFSLFSVAVNRLASIVGAETVPVLAPTQTNHFLGICFLGAVALFLWRKKQYVAAAVSSLLIASMPSFIFNARGGYADLLGAVMIVLSTLLLLQDRFKLWCAGALLLGLSVSVKPQNLFYAPILLLCFAHGNAFRRLKRNTMIPLLFAAAASLYFLSNHLLFGNPFENGYRFWVPSDGSFAKLFSITHFPENLKMLFGKIFLLDVRHTVADTYGTGCDITPALFFLSCLSLFFFMRQPKVRLLVCAFIPGTLLLLCYQPLFFEMRFLLPQILLCCLAAGQLFETEIRLSFRKNKGMKAFAFAGLCYVFLIFAVIGFPSLNCYKVPRVVCQLYDNTLNKDMRFVPLNYKWSFTKYNYGRTLQAYAVKEGFDSYLLLTETNPTIFNAMLGSECTAIPSDEEHLYRFSKQYTFGKREIEACVASAVRNGKRIFYIDRFSVKAKAKARKTKEIRKKYAATFGADVVLISDKTFVGGLYEIKYPSVFASQNRTVPTVALPANQQ